MTHIYAMQDKADDERIGVHSSARLFGDNVKLAVSICYALTAFFLLLADNSTIYLFALCSIFCAIILAGANTKSCTRRCFYGKVQT